MSHFTKIKTKLYNLVTIEKSLDDLNIKWESGAETIRNGQAVLCSAVIRRRSPFSTDVKSGSDFFPSLVTSELRPSDICACSSIVIKSTSVNR